MRAALLALVLFMSLPAEAAHLFVSTERPFAPDARDAIVKIEVGGARSVDVRLYRIGDPERFFASQPDLAHPSPLSAGAVHREPVRTQGPFTALGHPLFAGAADARAHLRRGLTPEAFGLLAPVAALPRARDAKGLPFLGGLELVERWDLACGGDGEFSFCDVDIGPRASGVYLVEAVTGKTAAWAVAIVSRLSLVARRSEDQLSALVVDGRGQPVVGAQVEVLAGGQVTVHGTTSKAGLTTAKVPPRPVMLVAHAGSDVAIAEVGHFASSAPEHRVFLATDRGEYRPGERLTYFGVARAGDEKLSLPHADEAELRLYDARGSLIATDAKELSAQGTFEGTFALPEGLPEGMYRVVALVDGAPSTAELLVRTAPAPDFDVQVRLDAGKAGQPLTAHLSATRHGQPVKGARFTWRLVRDVLGEGPPAPEEIDRGDVAAGDGGSASFSLDTPADADARFELTAVARDAEDRAVAGSARAVLLRGAVHARLTTDRALGTPGAPVTVTLGLSGADGKPVAGRVQLRVMAARAGSGAEGQRVRIVEQELATAADGSATFRFTPALTGYYEVEALSGKLRLAETFLYVSSEGGDIPFTPEALRLVPERDVYATGETARLLLLAPFDAASALFTVEGAGAARAEVVAIHGSSAVLSVKLAKELGPDVTVSAQAAVNGATFRAEALLHVRPRPEPLVVRPALVEHGGEARVEVEVLGRSGRPAANAELFVSVADARVADSAAPGLLAFFHPERAPEGISASSTAYRSSSSGHVVSRAMDGAAAEEGYLPFKALSPTRARPHEATTFLASAVTTDAHGRASLKLSLPPGAASVRVTARAVEGGAFGEARSVFERSVPVAGEAAATRSLEETPAPGLEETGRIGTTGVASVGRTRLPEVGPEARLFVAADLPAVLASARRLEGEAPALFTERATARLLLSLAARHVESDAEEPNRRALLDAAALVGLAHPEGGFGAYDGAPKDAALSADALVALALARDEGLDIEAGTLTRSAARLAENHKLRDDVRVTLALAAAHEGVEPRLEQLLDLERRGELHLKERSVLALALAATDQESSAQEVAGRLSRSVRIAQGAGCLSEDACSAEGPTSREALRTTAIGTLALSKAQPDSPALPALARALLLARGRGDFGGDVAGALAAFALASLPPSRGGPAPRVFVESGGRRTPLALHPGEELAAPAGRDVSLVVSGAPAFWRIERPGDAGSAAPLQVERLLTPLGADGKPEDRPLRRGDRVRVSLKLEAAAATGPVRIDDRLPEALAPVEQEGASAPWLSADESARRLLRGDRVTFLLPALPKGSTTLRYDADARSAGTFEAPGARVETSDGTARGSGEASPIAIEEAAK